MDELVLSLIFTEFLPLYQNDSKSVHNQITIPKKRAIIMNNSKIYTPEWLMEIIDALPLAISIFDQDRIVVLANKKTLEFTNKSSENLLGDIGGKAFGCIHHDDVPQGCGFGKDCLKCKLRTTLFHTMETRLPQTMVETTMVFKNLGEKHLRISSTPIILTSGDAVLLAMEDITQAKNHEQTKLEKEKLSAVIETAGAVCHEMNQPLMCILGYSEFLLDEISQDSTQYAHLMEIKNQVERLGEITRKLMSVTRYKTKPYLKGNIIDIEKASE